MSSSVRSTAIGSIKEGTLGKVTSFMVQAKDKEGSNKTFGGDRITLEVERFVAFKNDKRESMTKRKSESSVNDVIKPISPITPITPIKPLTESFDEYSGQKKSKNRFRTTRKKKKSRKSLKLSGKLKGRSRSNTVQDKRPNIIRRKKKDPIDLNMEDLEALDVSDIDLTDEFDEDRVDSPLSMNTSSLNNSSTFIPITPTRVSKRYASVKLAASAAVPDNKDNRRKTMGKKVSLERLNSRKISFSEFADLESLNILDNENGTYSISFCPVKEGRYNLVVKLNDIPIYGSPFVIFVKNSISICFTYHRSIQRNQGT